MVNSLSRRCSLSPSVPQSLIPFLLPLFWGLAACDRPSDPHVVLYVSADDHIARQVVDAFESKTGIDVRVVGDTEQTKTTGLANRLRAEKDHPRADVFWSSEVFMTVALAEEGVLAPYDSAAAADRPAAFRDPQNRWFGFGARARVIVYAPDRVEPSEVPRTWMDLTDPRLKGRVVIADPRFGTTGGHLGAMAAYWSRLVGDGYYDAFLMGLSDNDLRMLPSGNAGVVRAVAAGEADLGLTDTDDVWAAKARGLNLELVYPRHAVDGVPGGGTLMIPNTAALVSGGPNPQHARRLLDFLLSAEVERMLAESVSHNVPVRPGLAGAVAGYDVPDPLDIDYRRAAAAMPGAVEAAMRRIGEGGDGDAG